MTHEAPGFSHGEEVTARKVYERLNCESKPNGDFGNTIISLIFNFNQKLY